MFLSNGALQDTPLLLMCFWKNNIFSSNSIKIQPSTQQSFYYFNSTICFYPIGSSSGVTVVFTYISFLLLNYIIYINKNNSNTGRWPNRVETCSGIEVMKRLLRRRLKLCTITRYNHATGCKQYKKTYFLPFRRRGTCTRKTHTVQTKILYFYLLEYSSSSWKVVLFEILEEVALKNQTKETKDYTRL
jgi:hypothetical protein